MKPPSSCAICGSASTDLVRDVDGIWECGRCRTVAPRDMAPGRAPRDLRLPAEGVRGWKKRVTKAKNAIVGAATREQRKPGVTVKPCPPGWTVHRVAKAQIDGHWMDADDAHDLVSGEPWFTDCLYLGRDEAGFLFAIPPTAEASP